MRQSLYRYNHRLAWWLLPLIVLGQLLVGYLPNFSTSAQAAGVPDTFDPANLIDNTSFIDIDSMSVDDVQNFLNQAGGALASYSENGRSAAQIIWGASHGQGDGSGSINGITIDTNTGTVNPKVLLVTLQKEQSLITSTTDTTSALNTAMGYGCPDSGGCIATYQGFTKQVENAAWQLRYNYERATKSQFNDYQVGQTMAFSSTNGYPTQSIVISNASTASLYRYTPHIYNGNYNFWHFYRQWFAKLQGSIVTKTSDVTLGNTESAMFAVSVLNSGEDTWTKSAIHLGTSNSHDRTPAFLREDQIGGNTSGWLSGNRVSMVENSVAPGETGTFRFYYTVPKDLAAGTYNEAFNLVNEGVSWFPDLGLSWNITVVPLTDSFKASVTSKSADPTVSSGQSTLLTASIKNTGYVTWKQGTVNLGTYLPADRVPRFIREDQVGKNPSGWLKENRVQMVESSVAPGGTGTFQFYYTVPQGLNPGDYQETFRPVYENVAWLKDLSFDLTWTVHVISSQQAQLKTQWLSQDPHTITLKPGESHQFSVTLKNTSTAIWQQGMVNLGTDRDRDRIPRFIREDQVTHNPSGWISANRVQMSDASVAPGKNATFTFWYTIPNDTPSGTYREYFRPVNDSLGWMDDWGIYWDITVAR